MLKMSESQGIVEVRLHRPELRNAFNPEMIQALRDQFYALSQRNSVRLVIIRGEGKSFCAGADLNWMQQMVNFTHDQNITDSLQLFEMFEMIMNCPHPVVSYVQGHAMGGALGILACSDIVIAETPAQFCFSEVKLGIVPAVISAFVLRKIPRVRVSEWMLTGKVFSAEQALSIGLVQHVAEPSEAQKYLDSLVEALRSCGPEAVRATKQLLLQVPEMDWESTRDYVSELIAERRVSHEGQEGLRAFLEKRSASWKQR